MAWSPTIAQVAKHQGHELFVSTRPCDLPAQEFARTLGAVWAGDSNQSSPAVLEAAILFAPAGAPVSQVLAVTRKGGTVVCVGTYIFDIPAFPYSLLWGGALHTVGREPDTTGWRNILPTCRGHSSAAEIMPFWLEDANGALAALRAGAFQGDAVLVM